MEQKKLTELSLDELWQLFPITLTVHQDYWADWYKEEAELLKERLRLSCNSWGIKFSQFPSCIYLC